MAKYSVLISGSAEKALKKIPKSEIKKILSVIEGLRTDPTPPGCRKLAGEDRVFRVRQGNYRIIYEIENRKLIILVLKIGHRKDIYR